MIKFKNINIQQIEETIETKKKDILDDIQNIDNKQEYCDLILESDNNICLIVSYLHMIYNEIIYSKQISTIIYKLVIEFSKSMTTYKNNIDKFVNEQTQKVVETKYFYHSYRETYNTSNPKLEETKKNMDFYHDKFLNENALLKHINIVSKSSIKINEHILSQLDEIDLNIQKMNKNIEELKSLNIFENVLTIHDNIDNVEHINLLINNSKNVLEFFTKIIEISDKTSSNINDFITKSIFKNLSAMDDSLEIRVIIKKSEELRELITEANGILDNAKQNLII